MTEYWWSNAESALPNVVESGEVVSVLLLSSGEARTPKQVLKADVAGGAALHACGAGALPNAEMEDVSYRRPT